MRAALANGRSSGLESVAAALGVRQIFGACSGRAALWVILKSLQRLRPQRGVVAIPAYTCFSVAASVVRAGLKVYPIELCADTLDLDYQQLERLPDGELLCMVSANLFGFMNDLPRMQQIASAKGAFLVDDAAQALGATRDGRAAGTTGDVGLFSLARGKALPAGEGGVIVTNNEEIAAAVRQSQSELSPASWAHGAAQFCKVLAGSVLLSPRLYRIPNALPFLKLGVTEYDPGFAVTELTRLSSALLGELWPGLEGLNRGRTQKARAIARAVRTGGKFRVPAPPPNCSPTFIRMPLLAPDQRVRDRAVEALRQVGIGASGFYPTAVCDIEAVAPHMAGEQFHQPQAEELARRILTLPTHPLVEASDVERMAEVLDRVA